MASHHNEAEALLIFRVQDLRASNYFSLLVED